VAELHVHGSRAVLAALTATLALRPGLRLAEPGEFTRRAFHEGKLDLAEVEGLADLIAAETEAQRRQALRQLEGELGRLTESWRARLLRALAHAEAEIDFPDEDLPGGLIATLAPDLSALADEIETALADQRRGERLRAGLSLAIIGPPNAGKSSLLNWLARREAAIVSATAGTTRDVIELQLDLGGYPVVVADTAGLRELSAAASDDPHTAIEREGIARARARAAAADLKLLVLDASTAPDPAMLALIDGDTVVVLNKTDLVSEGIARGPSPAKSPLSDNQISPDFRPGTESATRLNPPPGDSRQSPGTLPQNVPLEISLRTGNGLDLLLKRLEVEVAERLGTGSGMAPVVTRARHRLCLEECRVSLRRALLQDGKPAELLAEDLRLAARALGRITGRVGVDDILDLIFREFCIGK
jgi:tRNA modification GTPase